MLFRYSYKNGKKSTRAVLYTESEHKINRDLVDPFAIRIIQRLKLAGFDSYIVGGAVRDLIYGNVPKDFDIVTSAEPTKIRKIFKNSRIIGKRFRLVHVIFGDEIYEVSTFRSIENGSVGNTFGTIEEDVQRRDFTINAMYYDPLKNHVIDYVNGYKHLSQKKLIPVISRKIIFTEDPVRMIRAIKYSVTTNSTISFFLRRQIKKDAHQLEFISPSRLTEEINKIISSGHSAQIVKELLNYNLYNYIQPSACSFIEDVSSFKDKYFDSLTVLDKMIISKKNLQQGKKLVYLIRDFIELIFDKNMNCNELFSFVYKECRHFILPMNPQRLELAYAVRFCLRRLGAKISYFNQKNSSRKKTSQVNRKKRIIKDKESKDTKEPKE